VNLRAFWRAIAPIFAPALERLSAARLSIAIARNFRFPHGQKLTKVPNSRQISA